MNRISAVYDIESPVGVERAAQIIAGEQSTGTFVKLAAETDELKAQSSAIIERTQITAQNSEPSLPCKVTGSRYERGLVTISWPADNIGSSLPNLLATVAGNLFELAEVSALRLVDLIFPPEYVASFPGPRFGAEGTRQITGVSSGPLIGTIIKPSVGLNAEETARLVKTLVDADIDFIKDDELQANSPNCSLEDRVVAVMRVLDQHEERTGKRVMYAFNITDDIESMRRHYDLLVEKRACCAMVSLFCVGLPGLQDVRRHGELVIHGHRAGWGLFSRSPDVGISFAAMQKLWRLAGADHLHVNGFANKFSEDDETVAESAQAVSLPLGGGPETGFGALPVFSSAQTIWQMEPAHRVVANSDFLLTAGGGIMSHPGGPGAGVVALRQAALCMREGIALSEGARDRVELKDAMSTFEKPAFSV